MKRRLLLLLVAVLLMRGWAGEVMAGQMLSLQLQGTPAVTQAHAPHEDCAQAAGEATDDADADASCALCQGCSMHALPAIFVHAAQPLPHARDAGSTLGYRSADISRVSKPPIA